MLRLIAAAAATVMIAASAMPAAAQDVMQVHVSFADLNLSNPDGQAALAHRVARAVDEVCGSENEVSFESARLVRRCRDDAFKGVNASVQAAIAQSSKTTLMASR
jgi:UrcA family protein